MPDPEASPPPPGWIRSPADPHAADPPKQLGPVLAVAVGGALGGSARYAVGEVLPRDEHGMPWATLSVNVSGAFVLAVLLVLVLDLWPPRRYVRPFVATGFLGAYTTFSSLAVEVDQLLSDGALRTASMYLALTLVAGLGAAWIGLLLGHSVVRRSASDRPHHQRAHDKKLNHEEEPR